MQKGFAPIFILIGTVILAAVGYGGYYFYQQQQVKNINSQITDYESCIRLQPDKPRTLIYPGNCLAPDGRSFTQELSDEEKKNLIPPMGDENADWEKFENYRYGYSLSYPSYLSFKEENDLRVDEISSVRLFASNDEMSPIEELFFKVMKSPVNEEKFGNIKPEVVTVGFSKGNLYETRGTGVAGRLYRVEVVYRFDPHNYWIILNAPLDKEAEAKEFLKDFLSRIESATP